MNTRIIIVPKSIREENFSEWLKTADKEIRVIKIKKTTLSEIRSAIMDLEDYHDRWSFYQEAISRIWSMSSKGKPDFFIANKKMFLLAEFKSNNDSLSQDQIVWFEKNKDLPLAIILAYDLTGGLKDKLEVLSPNIITEEELKKQEDIF